MKIYNKNKTLRLFAVIALFILANTNIKAQTPGGTGLATEVWLSADRVNGPNGTLPANEASIEVWSPVLPGGKSYVKNDHTTAANNLVPTFIRTGSSLMNFQPHLYFGENATKLINKDNLLDLTKAYYLFHVSRTASSGTYRVIFTFSANNSTARNNSVGWYNGAPYMEIGGSNRLQQSNGKLYGISASIIPNKTGTGSSVPSSYMNGVANSATFAATTFATGTYTTCLLSVILKIQRQGLLPETYRS